MGEPIVTSFEARLISRDITPRGEFARQIKAELNVSNVLVPYAKVLDQYSRNQSKENEEALMTVLWFILNNHERIPQAHIERINRWNEKLIETGDTGKIAGNHFREKASYYLFYFVCARIARQAGQNQAELKYLKKCLWNADRGKSLHYPVGTGEAFDDQNMIVSLALGRYLTLTQQVSDSQRPAVLKYFKDLNYKRIPFPNFLTMIRADEMLYRAHQTFKTREREGLIDEAEALAETITRRTGEEERKGMAIRLDQIRLEAQIAKARGQGDALAAYQEYHTNSRKYLEEIYPVSDRSRIPEAKRRVHDALLNMAEITMELRDYENLKKYLTELDQYSYSGDSDTRDRYLSLKGHYLLQQDEPDFNAAIAKFEKIEKPFNRNFSLALAYFQKGTRERSEESLSKARSLFESLQRLPTDRDLNVVLRLYLETLAATENLTDRPAGLVEALKTLSGERSASLLGLKPEVLQKDLSPLTQTFVAFYQLKLQSREQIRQISEVQSLRQNPQALLKVLADNSREQQKLESTLKGQLSSAGRDELEVKRLLFRVQTAQLENQIEALQLSSYAIATAKTQAELTAQTRQVLLQIQQLEEQIKNLDQPQLLTDQKQALESMKLSLALKSMELLAMLSHSEAQSKLVAVLENFKSEYLVEGGDHSLQFNSRKSKILEQFFPLSLWAQKLFQAHTSMEENNRNDADFATQKLAYFRFLENTFKAQTQKAEQYLARSTQNQTSEGLNRARMNLVFAVQAQCFWHEYRQEFAEAAKLFDQKMVLHESMRQFVLGKKLLSPQILNEAHLYRLAADKYKWTAVSRKTANRRAAYEKSLQYHNLAERKTRDADAKDNIIASRLQLEALFWLNSSSPHAVLSDETLRIQKELRKLQPQIEAKLRTIKSYEWGEQLLATYVYVTASLRRIDDSEAHSFENDQLNGIQAAVNLFIDHRYPCTRDYEISPDQLMKLQLLSASAIRDNYSASQVQIALAIRQYEQIKPHAHRREDLNDIELSLVELKSRHMAVPADIAEAKSEITRRLGQSHLSPSEKARLLLARGNVYLSEKDYERLAQNQARIVAYEFGADVSNAAQIGLKDTSDYQPDEALALELQKRISPIAALNYYRSTTWGLFMTDIRQRDRAGAEQRKATIEQLLLRSQAASSGDNSESARISQAENERYKTLLAIYAQLNADSPNAVEIIRRAKTAMSGFSNREIRNQFIQDFTVMLEVFGKHELIAQLAAEWYGRNFEKPAPDLNPEIKLICLKALKELSRQSPEAGKKYFTKDIDLIVAHESQKLAVQLQALVAEPVVKNYLLEEVNFLKLEHYLNLKQRHEIGGKVDKKALSLAEDNADEGLDYLKDQKLAGENQLRFYLDRIYYHQSEGRFDLAQGVLNEYEAERAKPDSSLKRTLDQIPAEKRQLTLANFKVLQANNHLWSGNHRVALQQFESILAHEAKLHASIYRQAQMGLAHAYLYQGYKDRAVEELAKVESVPDLGGEYRNFDQDFKLARDKSFLEARANTLQVQMKVGTQTTSNRSHSSFYFPRYVYHPSTNKSVLSMGKGESDLEQTTERYFADLSMSYEFTHALKVEVGLRPQKINRVSSQYSNTTTTESYSGLGPGYPETGQTGLQMGRPELVGSERSGAATFDMRASASYLTTFNSQALSDIRFLSNQVMLSGSYGREEFFNRPDLGLAVDKLNPTHPNGSVRYSQLPAKSVPRYLEHSQISLRNELAMSVYRQKLIVMAEIGMQNQEILERIPIIDPVNSKIYTDTKATNVAYPYGKLGVTMESSKLFSILTISPSVEISRTVPSDGMQPQQNWMFVPGIKVEVDLPWIKNWLNLDRLYLRGSYQRSTGNQFDFSGSYQESYSAELGGRLGDHEFGIGVRDQRIPYQTKDSLNTSQGILGDQQIYLFWQGRFNLGGDKAQPKRKREEQK